MAHTSPIQQPDTDFKSRPDSIIGSIRIRRRRPNRKGPTLAVPTGPVPDHNHRCALRSTTKVQRPGTRRGDVHRWCTVPPARYPLQGPHIAVLRNRCLSSPFETRRYPVSSSGERHRSPHRRFRTTEAIREGTRSTHRMMNRDWHLDPASFRSYRYSTYITPHKAGQSTFSPIR